jgi:hypothetical protein
MEDLAEQALTIARAIQADVPRLAPPSDEGMQPETEQVLPFSIVRDTRGYIEKVVNQINGSYERGWYDSCAVMIRRLIETLIIEAFEYQGAADEIRGADGNYLYLSDLVNKTLAKTEWSLSRNSKAALPRLKEIGDLSAHSRRFTAQRGDIDKIMDALRVVSQELIYLTKLK